ncbi:drug/metabolite transporter (DMT)-like permease [Crossiella equi]|uniref:Drug/metabolite transporter (DMT)-like permease n=1 Tax=Crossiella equi TaxID=130796 RepID=A0ABS5AEK3_9PSEU|nr:EamA family transporter [Crossiella equi]MBP2474130.1 drug/metabolite transporter (DMT)-like permease [Crossiella equi]
MSIAALSLVLAAAFAHAAWNFFAKRAGDGGVAFVFLYAVGSTVLYLPLAVGVVIVDGVDLGWSGLVAILVSAVLHLVYFLLLQRGYAVGDLSVVYPLARGTGPLVAVLAGVIFLGERPGLLGLLGALTVVAGVFVIGLGSARGGQALPAVAYGLVTGVVIAGYTLWDARAVTVLAISPLLLDWGNNLARVVLVTPYAVRHRETVARAWRAHRREVLWVAVLSPLGYILVLFAMRLAPVSLVAPARELSIVVGTVAGWRLLGEAQPVRRLLGAVVVLGGVVLLATA